MLQCFSNNYIDTIDSNDSLSTNKKNKSINIIKLNYLSERLSKQLISRYSARNDRKIRISSDSECIPKYVSSRDFIVDLNYENQYVLPYWYLHRTSVKKRWENKSLKDVLLKEWSYLEQIIGAQMIENYCKMGQIEINNKQCTLSQILQHNDYINIYQHKHEPLIRYNRNGYNINNKIGSLTVLRETNNMIVILKPATIPTHPSSLYHKNSIIWMLQNGYYTKTKIERKYSDNNDNHNIWFNNILKKQYDKLDENNYSLIDIENKKYHKNNNKKNKFWTVHRLDRLTSGLLIFAKNVETATYLMQQFQDRCIRKEYLALVYGKFNELKYKIVSAKIGKPINQKYYNRMTLNNKTGKSTETRFKLIWYNKRKNISLISCKPITGRTHQIRVHLSYFCNTPIINDPLYNKNNYIYNKNIKYDKNILNHVNKEEIIKHIDEKSEKELNINDSFKCHICENDDKSINIWWNDLISTTSVLNHGIYLHAFTYIGKQFKFQAPIPNWCSPPDNNTQIFSSIF